MIAALWSAFVGVCLIVAMTFVVWTAISAWHSWRYERGRKQVWEARRAKLRTRGDLTAVGIEPTISPWAGVDTAASTLTPVQLSGQIATRVYRRSCGVPAPAQSERIH
jgi:hypothetical protein